MAFRAFIAVDAKESLKVDRVLSDLRSTGAELKLVDPRALHATLKFLGDTEEEAVDGIRREMEASVEGIAPFEVAFRGIGAFPNPGHVRVVWVGMTGAEPLVQVARRLELGLARLGFKKEGGLVPHVTLARVKGRRNLDRLERVIRDGSGEEFGRLMIDRILLKKSVLGPSGPAYSSVLEVLLKPAQGTGERSTF